MTTKQLAWMLHAGTMLGVAETPGPRHTPALMAMIRRVGVRYLGIQVNDDEAPWCGAFVGDCMVAAGIEPPKICVRATSWATWGGECGAVFGAVMVFRRPAGGHVGLCVGWGMVPIKGKLTHCYRIRGGNQSNKVCDTWIEASRLIACRWPLGVPVSTHLAPQMTAGGKVSTNEA